MSGPKVVEFKRENPADAKVVLKQILARLESGDMPEVVVGVMVVYDVEQGLFTFGFGQETSDLHLISILELGKTQLIDGVFGA